MDQAGVQVLKKVHVRGAEAGVVIEVISGGDGEGDLRQLHHLDLTRSHEEERGGSQGETGSLSLRGGSEKKTGIPEQNWGPRGKLRFQGEEVQQLKTTAVGAPRKRNFIRGMSNWSGPSGLTPDFIA